jgi:hypothetical protein
MTKRTLRLLLAALVPLAVAWRYKDLPMRECAWCHRQGAMSVVLGGLQRVHWRPQKAYPELANDTNNVTVAMHRVCHFVIAHRCSWRTWNPDAREIVGNYETTLPIGQRREGE